MGERGRSEDRIDWQDDVPFAYHRPDLADKLIEIENRAARRDRDARRRAFALPAGRVRDLACFFAFTFGSTLPDDDGGRDDAFILAQHVARLNGDPSRNIARHVLQWCPWMGGEELAALVRRVLAKPLKWTAETLGQRISLVDEVRTKLRITTIRPIDVPADELDRRRRERWNAKRRKQTRDQYLAGSLSKAAPWQAEGVSRARWYRRQKAVRQVRVSNPFCGVTHTFLNTLPRPVAPPRKVAADDVCSQDSPPERTSVPPDGRG